MSSAEPIRLFFFQFSANIFLYSYPFTVDDDVLHVTNNFTCHSVNIFITSITVRAVPVGALRNSACWRAGMGLHDHVAGTDSI